MMGPHQLGLVWLEQQLQHKHQWDPVGSRFDALADEMHNFLFPLVGVVRCFFCSVWDWPCGSSHEPVEHPEFLSVPGCIACGFAEGLQCGLNAEHLGLPAGADEEQGMW